MRSDRRKEIIAQMEADKQAKRRRGGNALCRLLSIIYTLLAAAFVGLLAVVLTRLGLGNSVDKISIGNVMLLIPGISFTTSLRDMISGDTISGLLGLCEAILRALAIGLGFALVLWQFGM